MPASRRTRRAQETWHQQSQVGVWLLTTLVPLLPSPSLGLRRHGRSLALALTSTKKLLDPAQVGLLCGQYEGQDCAWVVGTRRPARRAGSACVSGPSPAVCPQSRPPDLHTPAFLPAGSMDVGLGGGGQVKVEHGAHVVEVYAPGHACLRIGGPARNTQHSTLLSPARILQFGQLARSAKRALHRARGLGYRLRLLTSQSYQELG